MLWLPGLNFLAFVKRSHCSTEYILTISYKIPIVWQYIGAIEFQALWLVHGQYATPTHIDFRCANWYFLGMPKQTTAWKPQCRGVETLK